MQYSITRTTVQALHDLQRQCLPNDVAVPTDADYLCWAAVDHDGPVAFIIVEAMQGHGWYLKRAGTLPLHSSRGLYKRLLRAAFKEGRRRGITRVVTDTTYWNVASANGLIGAGFRLFIPATPWAFDDGLYWEKHL